MKRFVDANILVSGLVFEGNESLLLDLARMGVCELVTNAYVREGVRDAFSRPRMELTAREQEGALAVLTRCVSIVDDPPPGPVRAARGRVPDEDDLPVLVGFERSGCDFLVTGDREIRRRIPRAISTRTALRKVLGAVGPP